MIIDNIKLLKHIFHHILAAPDAILGQTNINKCEGLTQVYDWTSFSHLLASSGDFKNEGYLGCAENTSQRRWPHQLTDLLRKQWPLPHLIYLTPHVSTHRVTYSFTFILSAQLTLSSGLLKVKFRRVKAYMQIFSSGRFCHSLSYSCSWSSIISVMMW